MTFEQRLEVQRLTPEISGQRGFQADRRASAKALRQKHSECVGGTAKRTVAAAESAGVREIRGGRSQRASRVTVRTLTLSKIVSHGRVPSKGVT